MNPEDVKRFALLCGWKEVGSRIHSPACQRDEENCGGKLPDFLQSKDAVIEALERFMKGKGYSLHCTDHSDGTLWYTAQIESKFFAEPSCRTLNEAIIRAVLKASESQKEHEA